MPTTFGLLTVPLGNARLQTVRLFASLLGTNSPAIYEEFARLNTLNVLLVSNRALSIILSSEILNETIFMDIFYM